MPRITVGRQRRHTPIGLMITNIEAVIGWIDGGHRVRHMAFAVATEFSGEVTLSEVGQLQRHSGSSFKLVSVSLLTHNHFIRLMIR
ncbi:hypothetical protein R77567_04741 [Ralstonia sp. LMG 32965]|uniref:Uncharacterized protein n=1 Tax=Ralstonia flatus TaxID=3058601 RepID=A0AAD2C5W1_9RALS|nr:hypothetical protein [Ralstonia pickettii]CAJ0896601.1 hypothetical protein R77567_04741 [Ralstonia sp. LMG 32965]CAJ0904702.1 hypothetical protein R77564_05154 [Ralstonia sp. LMG 32965]